MDDLTLLPFAVNWRAAHDDYEVTVSDDLSGLSATGVHEVFAEALAEARSLLSAVTRGWSPTRDA
jgi:hypothetical protein